MKNSYLVSAFGSYLLFRRLLVFPLVLLTMLVQARVNFADTYTQNFKTLAATGASNTWMNDVTIFSCDMDATGRGLRGLGSDGTYFSPAGAAVAGWIAVAFTNATSTSITSSQNPSLTNTSVTFTATVTSGGNPVTLGTVTFTVGATVIAANVPLNASGQASFSTSALTEGSHLITASYSGAAGFGTSSGFLTQVVNNPTSVNGNAFCNDLSGITINDNAPATPYPSNILVSGLSGPITSITVDIKGLTHSVPDDIDLLLVGPGGQRFVLMSGVGGANSVSNIDITFSDPAAIALPDNASVTSGTYRPASYESNNTFPAPAPAGTNNTPAPIGTATLASVFNGIDPNGTWRLFAVDDAGTNSGNIAGGWCLNITTENPCPATDTLYVDQSIGASGAGTSWTGAFKTLDEALYAAHNCPNVRVINVAAGMYKPAKKPYNNGVETTTGDVRDVTFHIPGNVAVYGGFPAGGGARDIAAHATILSGDLAGNDVFDIEQGGYQNGTGADNSYHVAIVVSSDGQHGTLDGFTLTGGHADGNGQILADNQFVSRNEGGALYAAALFDDTGQTITNNVFSYNEASSNGGALNATAISNDARQTITNNVFSYNEASSNGGALNATAISDDARQTIMNNEFSYNASSNGGALNASASSDNAGQTITNNVFSHNEASGNGGALYASAGFGNAGQTITQNVFSHNESANRGGALYVNAAFEDTRQTIANNAFTHNESINGGGALYADAAFGNTGQTITNNSFYANEASSGGAVFQSVFLSSVTGQLHNNIFWENKKSGNNNVPEADIRADGNINVSHCLTQANSQFSSGTGIINNQDPLFANPALPAGPDGVFGTSDDGLRLLGCSPVIDAGNNAQVPPGITTDLAGDPRFHNNGTVDMGAYEYSGPGCVLGGTIRWSTNPNQGVKDATVTITGDDTGSDMSDANGDYSVDLQDGGNITITPTKNINKFNGVTAADATRIQQHITGSSPLSAPFPRIAADVNKSNSITTADAGLITQALLGNQNANNIWNTSWRFVDADYVFPNPNAPWNFPESVSLTGVDDAVTDVDFIGIKLGDVTAPAANPQQRPQPVVLRASDRRLQAGETVAVAVSVQGYDDIAAFQFVLRFDPGALHLEGVETPAGGNLKAGQFALANAGELRAVSAKETGETLPHGAPWFTLRVTALADGELLSDLIALDETLLPAEAYTTDLYPQPVQLAFTQASTSATDVARESLTLSARPNPASGQTTLRFYLPAAADAQLRLLDAQGRVVRVYNDYFQAGTFEQRVVLPAAGLYFAELITPYGAIICKVIGE